MVKPEVRIISGPLLYRTGVSTKRRNNETKIINTILEQFEEF